MSRLLLVGGAVAGAYFARKIVRRKPASDTRDEGFFASSSEALSGLTAAAEEVLPVGGGRARVIDRKGAKIFLVSLVLAALATVASLWAGTVSTRAAVIGLTCIAGTLWTLLLSGNLVSSAPATLHYTQDLDNLAGTWIKDRAASSSMDAALDLAEIHGLLRKAICLLKGCEISFDQGDFVFAVTSVVPWFKVIERYPMTGETRQWRRRDLRKGKHTGYVEQQGSSICVHLDWDHPIAGHGQDRMSSPSENALVVESDCVIGGQALTYRTVYRRA
ncbi:hypothetical protein WJX74_003388 [Apatococcus lobatus]|uniref:Uncharacterized protein n=1 Tax=Apatococcus lobatus TaxID=904363 RepID=A0AAW1RJ29_9CHLO